VCFQLKIINKIRKRQKHPLEAYNLSSQLKSSPIRIRPVNLPTNMKSSTIFISALLAATRALAQPQGPSPTVSAPLPTIATNPDTADITVVLNGGEGIALVSDFVFGGLQREVIPRADITLFQTVALRLGVAVDPTLRCMVATADVGAIQLQRGEEVAFTFGLGGTWNFLDPNSTADANVICDPSFAAALA
jgi:hypothetical protein